MDLQITVKMHFVKWIPERQEVRYDRSINTEENVRNEKKLILRLKT